VAALREDVRSYLARNYRVTQKALANLAEMTEQSISDFLGKRERGLRAETFARLQFIVTNGAVPKSNRIVSAQRFGKPMPDLNLDNETMAEFENDHTATNFHKQREAIRNHNKGTTAAPKN
jgi:hypothetical protein